MIGALSSVDAATWATILLKALTYATTLLAAGSVMARAALRMLTEDGRARLLRLALGSALAAAALSALRLPAQASFLMGGTWAGAVDPAILSMVADGPLGTSVSLRLLGLALILCLALPLRAGRWLALIGAALVCASFGFRGHALGEPRIVLGGLITLHMLGLAFWIGAFLPLVRAARVETPAQAGALAEEFGAKALWVVAGLVGAGGVKLALLGGASLAAVSTTYGQFFALKLIVFAAILSLAAVNKLRLTPALLASGPGASARLRRTIGLEASLVAVIFLTTAAVTTLTAPPRDMAGTPSPAQIAFLDGGTP